MYYVLYPLIQEDKCVIANHQIDATEKTFSILWHKHLPRHQSYRLNRACVSSASLLGEGPDRVVRPLKLSRNR